MEERRATRCSRAQGAIDQGDSYRQRGKHGGCRGGGGGGEEGEELGKEWLCEREDEKIDGETERGETGKGWRQRKGGGMEGGDMKEEGRREERDSSRRRRGMGDRTRSRKEDHRPERVCRRRVSVEEQRIEMQVCCSHPQQVRPRVCERGRDETLVGQTCAAMRRAKEGR
eukprot:752008-Hanusia_phi.AAC.1